MRVTSNRRVREHPAMDAARDWLERLPKVELHVHLEGTIEASTALALASRHGVDLPALAGGTYPARYEDFGHFVETFVAASSVVRTADDLEHVAADFARRQAAMNVIYTEVTFTAATLLSFGMSEPALWRALRNGLSESGPAHEIRVIIDAVRNFGQSNGHQTVALAERAVTAGVPVVGLGLSGLEGSVPEREFAMLRAAADRLGLGLSVHAGEYGPAASIWAALDDLGADRIGHGVAAATDEDLMDRLKREEVPLEVCPTSNVTLGIFPTLEDHPFPRLWRAGLNVTINSDDPPFFATTLTDELAHAARLARLTRADVIELQTRAIRAAFCDDATKQRLLERLPAT